MLADEGHHVCWPRYTGQSGVEYEFRHARGCLDFSLENIRLQRIQQALLEQIGWHLIRHCLPSFNEHLVSNSLRLGGEDGHPDRRKYVEVVRLTRQKCLVVISNWRELDACRVDGLPLRPSVGLLGRAFRMFCGIRKRKDHRPLVDARHALNDFLRESAADGANTDDGCRLDAFDRGHEFTRWRVIVCIGLLEIDEVLSRRLQEPVYVEHVDAGLSLLEAHPLPNKCGTQQVGKADSSGAGAQEQ